MARCRLASCKKIITRRTYRSNGTVRQRLYCGNPCWFAALRERNMALVGTTLGKVALEPPDSPARVPTWREVPRTCACGGLWRVSPYAVQCRQCGRDLYIVAALPT